MHNAHKNATTLSNLTSYTKKRHLTSCTWGMGLESYCRVTWKHCRQVHVQLFDGWLFKQAVSICFEKGPLIKTATIWMIFFKIWFTWWGINDKGKVIWNEREILTLKFILPEHWVHFINAAFLAVVFSLIFRKSSLFKVQYSRFASWWPKLELSTFGLWPAGGPVYSNKAENVK